MAAVSCSCSWLILPSKMKGLTLTSSPSSVSNSTSLGFSKNLSHSLFSQGTSLSLSLCFGEIFNLWVFFVTGSLSLSTLQRRGVVVCETAPKQKVDSAVKRARQAEKRRIYNKARKSEIRTRTKKVFIKLC